MENKKMLNVFALGIIALLGISFVAAYQGNYSAKGPNYSNERYNAMHDAFDNLDYNSWINLMTESGRNPQVLSIVTEDNFATFVEIHEAEIAGDSIRASELRAELGLRNRNDSENRSNFGNGNGMKRGLMQNPEIGCKGNHNAFE